MPAFAGFCRSRWTSIILIGLLTFAALLGGSLVISPTAKAASGGPIALMGIDAEDGGPGGHGPISVYESVLNDILGNVTNGGSGVLVIGAGKAPGDSPTTFWSQIDADIPEAFTFVNDAANIAGQSLAGFKVIAVVSDVINTPSGGLTAAEHDALSGRQTDVASFVNGGGGLLGFSSDFANPYAYLGGVGAFTFTTGLDYSDITPTAEGSAIGITDALDICCWHDEYATFPPFLKVLATNSGTGQPAAIGGANVVVSDIQLAPTTAQNPVGTSHTLTATVNENGSPKSGVTVTFKVLSGPHAGTTGTGDTNTDGEATFSYTGTTAGTDTIEASFLDGSGQTQTSNQVTKDWTAQPNSACTITGTPQDDVLHGTAKDDVICGLGGDDLLLGKRGDDRLIGGSGKDRLLGGTGKDRLEGGSGNDRLEGLSGDDRLLGGTGDDQLEGGSGNDRLEGQSGDDRLEGGTGDDELLGGSGDDRLLGGTGNDRLQGGSGNDRLEGQSGEDQLLGGTDSDHCNGGPATDTATGCEAVVGVP